MGWLGERVSVALLRTLRALRETVDVRTPSAVERCAVDFREVKLLCCLLGFLCI